MNIAKHMEVVFILAIAAIGSVSVVNKALPDAEARPAAFQDSSIATETKMAVVVVKGKRLAREQAPTLLADRGNGSRM